MTIIVAAFLIAGDASVSDNGMWNVFTRQDVLVSDGNLHERPGRPGAEAAGLKLSKIANNIVSVTACLCNLSLRFS